MNEILKEKLVWKLRSYQWKYHSPLSWDYSCLFIFHIVLQSLGYSHSLEDCTVWISCLRMSLSYNKALRLLWVIGNHEKLFIIRILLPLQTQIKSDPCWIEILQDYNFLNIQTEFPFFLSFLRLEIPFSFSFSRNVFFIFIFYSLHLQSLFFWEFIITNAGKTLIFSMEISFTATGSLGSVASGRDFETTSMEEFNLSYVSRFNC